MRHVADIPHPKYKIQVHNYNQKYIVKIELGQFEQVYKLDETEVSGLDELKNMINKELLSNSLHRFIAMREDWLKAFQNKYVKSEE